VDTFRRLLRDSFVVLTDLPPLTGIVRDPNDDMIVACAVAAGGSHVVTRDHDLLALGVYEEITIVTPEMFWGRCGASSPSNLRIQSGPTHPLPIWGNRRDGAMRRNEDRKLLKTQNYRESLPLIDSLRSTTRVVD
jgi:predicted nuclease of predicted toxin-antitoxin system